MSADFFENQDTARRNTGRLVWLFGLAVVAIFATLYLLAVAVSGVQGQDARTGALQLEFVWWNPELLSGVLFAVLVVVGGGSLFKIAQLRGGGRVIAEQLGGKLVHPHTTDRYERILHNVVEEMAIASGTPTPPIYLLEEEQGINAFAAGFSPDDAVVGVTRGAIVELDRDELQGVIAHEFSHILNGDMRLNIRLMGVLHGILIIGIIGYFLLRSAMFSGAMRRNRDNNGMLFLALGLGLIVIGSLGTFFGNWIKASVSRQREFLADASAVQFTRNPLGIAAALKRIGGFEEGSQIASPNAPEASHMFFGQALRGGLQSIFATHPPLEERIRRLDPSFEGSAEGAATSVGPATAGVAGLATGAAPLQSRPLSVEHAVRDIGHPTPAHLAYAAELVRSLPDALREAAHEPFGARALVYCLVIDRDPVPRAIQLRHLAGFAEPGVEELAQELLPLCEDLPAGARMPLVDMTLPALRELSPDQYRRFRGNLEALVRADDKIDLFEWTLQRILLAHLIPHFEAVRPPRVKFSSLRPLEEACCVLLSTLALARAGADPEGAYERAASELEVRLPKLPARECGLARMDEALFKLSRASPSLKRKVLQTCADYIAADGRVAVSEAELLRATADTLGCPMPPLLALADG